ncbi:DUF342 domain-containing protein [Rossellomorea aquimaris]|uniref:DUF342 domain-containing protein n=1 Tax=Rossellomorea aquimaris TaxID=189382 RepID=UPI0007D0AA46|nr:FapA family protein [Rossellomorea aquimaris]
MMKNDYFSLTEKNAVLYINVNKKGFNILQFNSLIKKYPRVSISDVITLRDALQNADSEDTKIGYLKPEIECSITADEMEADVILHITEEQFLNNKNHYYEEVKKRLQLMGVKKQFIIQENMELIRPGIPLVVARGEDQVNGEDARISFIEKAERKPSITEEGKADYFDMNFFTDVKTGDWLGEKEYISKGKNGVTLLGKIIPFKAGSDKPLLYDMNSVMETEENNKTVLRARRDGIVEFTAGKISVGEHLFIEEDVGVETGNIDFDGSVTIRGTIQPGYSVRATKDISILGLLGVSSCKSVISTTGDIFIKGGVYGNNKTLIEAGRDIYVKHANECSLKAKELIFIGFYSKGCTLHANHIKTDESKGRIVGGYVKAKGSIVTGTVGNKAEKKTELVLEGIEREEIEKEYKHILLKYKQLLKSKEKLQKATSSLSDKYHKLNGEGKKKYDDLYQQLVTVLKEIMHVEQERKSLATLLKVKGNGEVTVLKNIYPNSTIEFFGCKKRFKTQTRGTFYMLENDIHYEKEVDS